METKDYALVDKNSDIVIICSGENEKDVIERVKDRLKDFDTSFRLEER